MIGVNKKIIYLNYIVWIKLQLIHPLVLELNHDITCLVELRLPEVTFDLHLKAVYIIESSPFIQRV